MRIIWYGGEPFKLFIYPFECINRLQFLMVRIVFVTEEPPLFLISIDDLVTTSVLGFGDDTTLFSFVDDKFLLHDKSSKLLYQYNLNKVF